MLVAVLAAAVAAPAAEVLRLEVDGVSREALVAPGRDAKAQASPLVFVFHGHGGGMRQVARSYELSARWPEATVVCPQGLPTPGRLTDPEGRLPGWQKEVGDQGDRDLKFFDALLARVGKDWKVDPRRVYVTGHSNGGAFSYLLCAARGEVFAAAAPSAAVWRDVPGLKPLPVLHLAGEQDQLVRYRWQELMITTLRRRNGCGAEPERRSPRLTAWPSEKGTPVLTWIHPGGHEFPREAVPDIVAFFKSQARPEKRGPQ